MFRSRKNGKHILPGNFRFQAPLFCLARQVVQHSHKFVRKYGRKDGQQYFLSLMGLPHFLKYGSRACALVLRTFAIKVGLRFKINLNGWLQKLIFLTPPGIQICRGFKVHNLITCEWKVRCVISLGS